MIVGSATSCIIALTWAGVKFSWSSPQVLAPLIIGLVGLVAAIFYDARYASHPVVSIPDSVARPPVERYELDSD